MIHISQRLTEQEATDLLAARTHVLSAGLVNKHADWVCADCRKRPAQMLMRLTRVKDGKRTLYPLCARHADFRTAHNFVIVY